MSVATAANPSVGDLLETWRLRRRLSRLDLAGEAEVSARHLGFGRRAVQAQPRAPLYLAEHFDVALRARNALLLAAGYASVHPKTPLEDETMAQ